MKDVRVSKVRILAGPSGSRTILVSILVGGMRRQHIGTVAKGESTKPFILAAEEDERTKLAQRQAERS